MHLVCEQRKFILIICFSDIIGKVHAISDLEDKDSKDGNRNKKVSLQLKDTEYLHFPFN